MAKGSAKVIVGIVMALLLMLVVISISAKGGVISKTFDKLFPWWGKEGTTDSQLKYAKEFFDRYTGTINHCNPNAFNKTCICGKLTAKPLGEYHLILKKIKGEDGSEKTEAILFKPIKQWDDVFYLGHKSSWAQNDECVILDFYKDITPDMVRAKIILDKKLSDFYFTRFSPEVNYIMIDYMTQDVAQRQVYHPYYLYSPHDSKYLEGAYLRYSTDAKLWLVVDKKDYSSGGKILDTIVSLQKGGDGTISDAYHSESNFNFLGENILEEDIRCSYYTEIEKKFKLFNEAIAASLAGTGNPVAFRQTLPEDIRFRIQKTDSGLITSVVRIKKDDNGKVISEEILEPTNNFASNPSDFYVMEPASITYQDFSSFSYKKDEKGWTNNCFLYEGMDYCLLKPGTASDDTPISISYIDIYYSDGHYGMIKYIKYLVRNSPSDPSPKEVIIDPDAPGDRIKDLFRQYYTDKADDNIGDTLYFLGTGSQSDTLIVKGFAGEANPSTDMGENKFEVFGGMIRESLEWNKAFVFEDTIPEGRFFRLEWTNDGSEKLHARMMQNNPDGTESEILSYTYEGKDFQLLEPAAVAGKDNIAVFGETLCGFELATGKYCTLNPVIINSISLQTRIASADFYYETKPYGHFKVKKNYFILKDDGTYGQIPQERSDLKNEVDNIYYDSEDEDLGDKIIFVDDESIDLSKKYITIAAFDTVSNPEFKPCEAYQGICRPEKPAIGESGCLDNYEIREDNIAVCPISQVCCKACDGLNEGHDFSPKTVRWMCMEQEDSGCPAIYGNWRYNTEETRQLCPKGEVCCGYEIP